MSIDFIGIGAQKSGTTWLQSNLRKTNGFDVPPIKELHYFDRSVYYPSPNELSEKLVMKRILSQGYLKKAFLTILKQIKKRNYKLVKFYIKWYFFNYTDSWYISLFKDFNGITGEISPSYSILDKSDIERMFRLAPNAKLILILRNPIHRAWSHYRWKLKNNKNITLENSTNEFIKQFIESDEQILRSDYLRTINEYSKVFPKGQILICFYDAIEERPQDLLNDIISFITDNKKEPLDTSAITKIVNKSPEFDCPEEIEEYLKEKYLEQISVLSNRYGGYFNRWLENACGRDYELSDIKMVSSFVI